MQRWPKYGGTDVNTRTVHDLLNTINTMSARIKTLERYEHALREIHKVVVILKPSANTHSFEPDALPALIMQFLSDFAGRDINTLTHNINYKYDYNYPPAPVPAMQPPPPPPQPPAPPQPPYYNNYPYYPPYPFSTPPPTQPPESNVAGVGGSQSLNQITLTNEEESELAALLKNMQTNMTWELVQNFVEVLIRIVRVHVVNNVTMINVISSITSVRTLIDYNFTEFIRCVYQKTNIRFAIDQYLCTNIVTFIDFFTRVFYLVTRTNFQFTTFDQLTQYSNELYTRIQTSILQSAAPLSPPTVETVNSDIVISNLQEQLKRERALMQQITEQHRIANERVETLQSQYDELDLKYKEIFEDKSEFAQQKSENVRKIKQLERSNKELNDTVQKLRDENAERLSEIQLQKGDLDEYKNMNRQLNEDIYKLKRRIESTFDKDYVETLNDKIESLEKQLDDKQNLNRELRSSISKIDETTQRYKLDAKDIMELKQSVSIKDQEIAMKNAQYLELSAIHQQTVNELTATKNELSQVATTNQSLFAENEESKVLLEGTLAFIDSFYQIIMQIENPDYVPISKPQLTAQESIYQTDYIKDWLQKLRSKLSNADVANLQSVSELSDLKSQIISIVPRNIVNRILKENYKVKVENVNAELLESVAVTSAVSALVQQYERSEKQNVRLRQEFEIKLNDLQRLLEQNQTDFESISEFISRDPAFNRNLNDERFQNLRQQYDEMSSKYSALETTKIKEMESIADQAVKSEMSKLNTQLDELNSLFVKYNRKAQDIFEWKTSMLKRYETLARTTAASVQPNVE
ncbi:unknown [Plutella xylostella multiple nucleopolyhedrovirus]|uniref:Viral desmoplakin N-terminal domain-containing protein n=1 Tax=Plutella xylostella multiple nucleopolyhedrovirus TaxID=379891 RepID=Q0GYF6_9ABAC|nr:unknown [Plutella xylostella multiple nucleopolyhedrovirus]